MARSASGKRAAVRRGRACSTAATRANVTALSPKSETKLPKKHAPNGGRPSALPSAVVSAIPPVVVQPNTKYEMGVEVSDAITPRPSPVGTAVLRLRNRPARAASPAYSATMTWTTTNGQNVGLRSVFTAEVSTPTAMPTTGPASAVAELVLEAYAGRETPHTRIAVGLGVCGTAVATGEDQNVPDVGAVGNYLACNLDTKSELVVLIRRGPTILGQIDIDSDVPAGFTEAHHRAVKEVADALAVLL